MSAETSLDKLRPPPTQNNRRAGQSYTTRHVSKVVFDRAAEALGAITCHASCLVLGETASPRNTRTAWLSRRMSSSSSLPTRAPTLVFGHGGNLVHHQATRRAQAIALARLHRQSKQRRVGLIRREGYYGGGSYYNGYPDCGYYGPGYYGPGCGDGMGPAIVGGIIGNVLGRF